MEFRITKLEAARRQLNFAIQAMFEESDALAVHTLIGAASSIISNLVDPENSWDKFAQEAKDLKPKDYFRIIRESQNFLKHADRDATEEYVFNPRHTEDLAFWAVMNLGEISQLSIEESIFQLWYLASHAKEDQKMDHPWNRAIEIFGDLSNLRRAERLKKGLEILNKSSN